tara:strand:+ start:419 stop:562 length:144 start_codon:yes stop_codon:yes gene_type:complete
VLVGMVSYGVHLRKETLVQHLCFQPFHRLAVVVVALGTTQALEAPNG